ncbi:MAG: 50S ribosomal protein L21e [Candidatus Aenigmarchaeota archaeon]|nr:50S ribosomal protein L21e [Candidatus Aenigmarchaeota archaeon]
MVRKSVGPRKKTRHKLKSDKKLTITEMIRKFNIGDRVHINIRSESKGFPHPKFQGAVGKIVGKRGNAYIVEVKDRKKTKKIISKAQHLHPADVKGGLK